MTFMKEKDQDSIDSDLEKGNRMIDEFQLKCEHIDSWMEEAGKQILQIISYVDQEKESIPGLKIRNSILHSILEAAAEEINVHFSVDRKTGNLIPHLLGPV